MSDLKYIWGYNNLYNSKKLIGIVNKGNKKVNKKGNKQHRVNISDNISPRVLLTNFNSDDNKYKILWSGDNDICVSNKLREKKTYSYTDSTSTEKMFSWTVIDNTETEYNFGTTETKYKINDGSNETTGLTILLIGDHGTEGDNWCDADNKYITEKVNSMLKEYEYNSNYASALLIAGDVSYATGSDNKWDNFDTEMSKCATSTIPTLTAFGNHDYYTGQNGSSNGEGGYPLVYRYNFNLEGTVILSDDGTMCDVSPSKIQNNKIPVNNPIDPRYTLSKSRIYYDNSNANYVGVVVVGTSDTNNFQESSFNDIDKKFIRESIITFFNDTQCKYIIVLGHQGLGSISDMIANLGEDVIASVNVICSGHTHRNVITPRGDKPVEFQWGASGCTGTYGDGPIDFGTQIPIEGSTDFYNNIIKNSTTISERNPQDVNEWGGGYLRLTFPEEASDNIIAESIFCSNDNERSYTSFNIYAKTVEGYTLAPNSPETRKRLLKYWDECERK